MGSAKGWAFENESECLDFIAGGGADWAGLEGGLTGRRADTDKL